MRRWLLVLDAEGKLKARCLPVLHAPCVHQAHSTEDESSFFLGFTQYVDGHLSVERVENRIPDVVLTGKLEIPRARKIVRLPCKEVTLGELPSAIVVTAMVHRHTAQRRV